MQGKAGFDGGIDHDRRGINASLLESIDHEMTENVIAHFSGKGNFQAETAGTASENG
jgi:hypothetical protein